MNNFKMTYLLHLLFLVVISCQKKEKNSEFIAYAKPTSSKLVVVDSLVVPLDSVQAFSYDFCLIKDSIVFVFDKQDQLWLWNLKDNSIRKFSKKGNGPGEYILPVAISALDKENIFIVDRQLFKVILLNIEGKFKQSWNIYSSDKINEPATFHTFSRVYKNNDEIFLEYVSRNKKYSMEDEEYYYNTKVLNSFNLNIGKHNYYFPYEKDSPYKQKKFLISPFDPYIDFNGSKYLVVFPHDFRIYIYDRNKELNKVIEHLPYKFPPKVEGTSFNKKEINFSRDYVKYNVKKNAINNSALFLKENQDILIRQYTCPLHKEIPDDINFWRTNYFKQERFIQVIDVAKNKVLEEGLAVPEKLGKMIYAENVNKIIFSNNSKLNENNILYVTKIVRDED